MALTRILYSATVIEIIVMTVAVSQAVYVYQSYQKSVSCTSSYSLHEPRTLSEIQDIVKFAIAENVKIKVIGSQHSISDSICTTGIPIKLTHVTHFSYNPTTQIATVGAGAHILDFFENLHQHNRGVSGQPLYGGITIGGALGTGAHGSTLKHPSSLAQQIITVTFVDGRGNVRKVNENHPDFAALRVNLGLLGIIFEVEVATIPQYKLSIRHFPVSDNILWNGSDILKMAQESDHFQFFWFPTNKQIVLAIGNRTSVSEAGNCSSRVISEVSSLAGSAFSVMIEFLQKTKDHLGLFYFQSYVKLGLFKAVPGREPIFVEHDGETSCLSRASSTGFGHRMLTNKCKKCYWESGVMPLLTDDAAIVIPLKNLLPAMGTLREIFNEQLIQLPLGGITVRFLTSGDAFLATNQGGQGWAAVEWNTPQRWDKMMKPRLGLAAYQLIGQVLVEKYEGRPHWGKNAFHFTNPKIIRQAHPLLQKFISTMDTYDPNEVFMSTFGQRLKYGKSEYTTTPDIQQHCALNEFCVCHQNVDCGNGEIFDYFCGQFPGFSNYNACLPGIVEQIKSAHVQSLIDVFTTLDGSEDSVYNYLRQYDILKNVLVYN